MVDTLFCSLVLFRKGVCVLIFEFIIIYVTEIIAKLQSLN